jgi:hypothetical protein
VIRIALIIGIVGGALWISLAFFPPACVPVTAANEVFCNRLWTPALAAMCVGFGGLLLSVRPSATRGVRWSLSALVIGSAAMVGGNFGEYWLAYALPHQGPDGFVRGLLWMSVLVGLLTVLVASAVAGVLMSRSMPGLRWPSLLFVLPLSSTILVALVSPSWIGTPLGMLGILAGVFGLTAGRRQAELGL